MLADVYVRSVCSERNHVGSQVNVDEALCSHQHDICKPTWKCSSRSLDGMVPPVKKCLAIQSSSFWTYSVAQ